MQEWLLLPRETIHPDPGRQPQEILEKPRHNRWKNLELRELKPINTQHLTSFSKINSNKEHFRMLNHHQKMTLALIKTNLKEPKTIKYTTAANSSKDTEKPNTKKYSVQGAGNEMETHLTIIGVCTTICPENSGI